MLEVLELLEMSVLPGGIELADACEASLSTPVSDSVVGIFTPFFSREGATTSLVKIAAASS